MRAIASIVHSLPRAVAVALLGALIAPACLVLAYGLNPAAEFSVDRLPSIATGFYASERDGERTFVWTSGRAAVTLAGLDRRAPWSCTVRFRGARPPSVPQPDVALAVDGVFGTVRRATNEIQEVTVIAPERPGTPGLVLSIATFAAFVPGPADRRSLGVQVDRLGCRPAQSAVVLPPRRALRSAMLAGAAFGAALGLAGITAGGAVGGVALTAAAQAVPLSTGAAPYGAYPGTLVLLAAWLGLLIVVALKSIEGGIRQPLRNTAKFVVVFSGVAVYLKLLGLLHPSKAIVDAVFHAHRFESVLGGRFYFTQLSTSATPFPYAIGLYLFSVPWSGLTHDHVALLRVVVCASEAVAGALLYLMVVRTWGDRLVGAFAVGLFGLVPIAYVIVGYANLTNAFGASAALVAVAAITLTRLEPRHVVQFSAVVLLATLALISHISTFLLLLATLLALVLLYRVRGTEDVRAKAGGLLLATAAALVLSVALYWGHFGEVYKAQIARAREAAAATSTSVTGSPAAVPARSGSATPARPVRGRTVIPLAGRVAEAASQTVANLGWPVLALAMVGAWRLWITGGRDRLTLAVAAWAAVCVAFVAASIVAPAGARYQQDAREFIARVEHMTCPAAVLLAAVGAAWCWRAGTPARLASAALVVAALVAATRLWIGWLS